MPKSNDEQVVGFNYEKLPADVAKKAKKIARQIKSKLNLTLVDIGGDLLEIKSSLKHGEFCAWVLGEFGFSERTAQRYMQVARLAAKTDSVSDLPPIVLYALSSKGVKDAVRNDVIERIKAGEKFNQKKMQTLLHAPQSADPLSNELRETSGKKEPRSSNATAKQRLKPKPAIRGSSVGPVEDHTRATKVEHTSSDRGGASSGQFVRMTSKVGTCVVKYLPPADGETFWALIRRKEGHLLIVKVKARKPERKL